MNWIRWTGMGMALAAVTVGALFIEAPVSAGAGGGCRGRASTEGTGTGVTIAGLCFQPTVLRVEVGQTVTWTNLDDAPHNVAGATVEWGNYEERRRGESVAFTFDKPGTYPYYCFLHPGMTGAVVVGNGIRGDGDSGVQAARVTLASVPAQAFPAVAPLPAPAVRTISNSESRTRPFALGAASGAVAAALIGAFGLGVWRRRRA